MHPGVGTAGRRRRRQVVEIDEIDGAQDRPPLVGLQAGKEQGFEQAGKNGLGGAGAVLGSQPCGDELGQVIGILGGSIHHKADHGRLANGTAGLGTIGKPLRPVKSDSRRDTLFVRQSPLT